MLTAMLKTLQKHLGNGSPLFCVEDIRAKIILFCHIFLNLIGEHFLNINDFNVEGESNFCFTNHSLIFDLRFIEVLGNQKAASQFIADT